MKKDIKIRYFIEVFPKNKERKNIKNEENIVYLNITNPHKKGWKLYFIKDKEFKKLLN